MRFCGNEFAILQNVLCRFVYQQLAVVYLSRLQHYAFESRSASRCWQPIYPKYCKPSIYVAFVSSSDAVR